MKRVLIFIFFLLSFSRCDQVNVTPLVILPGTGEQRTLAGYKSRAGISSGITIQPELSPGKNWSGNKEKGEDLPTRTTTRNLPGCSGKNTDSLFISRLKHLRTQGIDPDMNEPLTRDYLFSPIDNRKFPSMITRSRESFIRVNFDNDILDYTDRFYTNGIKIEIISPGLQLNPLSRLMLPYWGSGTNYYGISLVQNMFTPSTTKTGGVLYGDRPYAAYLYLGSFKITNDPTHRFRQTSELDIGIIGPNSYGEWVQRSFHNSVPTNSEPLGWEYQVKNDLVLNYSVAFEKGVFSRKNFEILLSSTGNVGTLYTNFSGGGLIRAGWMNPYFANLGVSKKQVLRDRGLRNVQFFLFLKGAGKLVGYDATLQGGILNSSSSYILPASEISRVVLQSSAGIAFSWNGIRFDLEQFMLSPEFQDGWWHKWVHCAITFSL